MPEPHWSGRNPGGTGTPGPPGPQGPPGEPGATTLTDLTDVTGTPGTYGNTPTDDGTGNFPLTRTVTQEDLQAVLNSVAAVNWHNIGDPDEPPFWNGFTNVGPPWAPARWRLTLNNVVHLEGAVATTQTLDQPTVIFMLPPECSPGGNLSFLDEGGGVSRLVVQSDGAVLWDSYTSGGLGAEQFLSLSGINYSVGSASNTVAADAIAATFGGTP